MSEPSFAARRLADFEPAYVYVAGPLSDLPPQYLANVAQLSLTSRHLVNLGYVSINPAGDLIEGLMGLTAWPVEVYQKRSMDLLRLLVGRRGCLYVTSRIHADGRESAGVAAEIAEAKRLGIPVFESQAALDEWRAS